MVTINAQKYINQRFPTTKDKADCLFLDISLDNSKIKGIGEELEGSLSLEGFANLQKLDCSNQIKIVDLNLIDCEELREIHFSNNQMYNLADSPQTQQRTRKIKHSNNIKHYRSIDDNNIGGLTKLKLGNSPYLTTLNLSNNQLTDLKLSNYSSLTNVDCSNNELVILEAENNPNLTKLDCWKNQLQKLSLTNNPKLTKVNCSENNLTDLKIIQCNNLEELNCSSNNFIALDVSGCDNLKTINCSNNQLANLPLIANKGKLRKFKIGNNNDLEQHLTCLREFINLEYLDINNNLFYGSLEPLKNLVKLRYLNINNTNIDRGLEYLSESVRTFYCQNTQIDKEELKPLYYTLEEFKAWLIADKSRKNNFRNWEGAFSHLKRRGMEFSNGLNDYLWNDYYGRRDDYESVVSRWRSEISNNGYNLDKWRKVNTSLIQSVNAGSDSRIGNQQEPRVHEETRMTTMQTTNQGVKRTSKSTSLITQLSTRFFGKKDQSDRNVQAQIQLPPKK